jgi:hypothetical protein
MAKQTIVQLTDDLDGGTADETVKFGLDGRQYEIDLSDKNAYGLREVLAPYVSASTPLRKSARTVSMPDVAVQPAKRSATELGRIREWAQEQGFEVSTRGRIKGEILTAYDAAVAA